ncbi:hypothetical protein BLOT_004898 [Blomia tropicalis]|nr:hypothetical protein BLOT_004898 [Blomia tropicalis]
MQKILFELISEQKCYQKVAFDCTNEFGAKRRFIIDEIVSRPVGQIGTEMNEMTNRVEKSSDGALECGSHLQQ